MIHIMHDTASLSGKAVADIFAKPGMTVVDVGGLNINGSLRPFFEQKPGVTYICVDMEAHPSVDIVVKPGDPLPFATGSVDLIVSSSCFEHDPMFWMTFKELTRIVKLGGFIYISAPSNGMYHCHPGDNWRFYSDAGQSLAVWSGYSLGNEAIFPVRVSEVFHILPIGDQWTDFVCVWERVNEKETEIVTPIETANREGPLKKKVREMGCRVKNKF